MAHAIFQAFGQTDQPHSTVYRGVTDGIAQSAITQVLAVETFLPHKHSPKIQYLHIATHPVFPPENQPLPFLLALLHHHQLQPRISIGTATPILSTSVMLFEHSVGHPQNLGSVLVSILFWMFLFLFFWFSVLEEEATRPSPCCRGVDVAVACGRQAVGRERVT